MATTKATLRPLVFALALTMLVALAHGSFYVHRIHVFEHCMDVIKKDPPQSNKPSKKCDNVVKKSNLVGICSVLTPEDEQKISVERLVSLGRRYGQEFTPGARCGSAYIIPELPGPPLL
ncbi:hypothetical protein PVAP13_3KG325754 [Panicum virgatum]|uniref:Bifunctional inhibitor/plant lipid transfer protein/seed storage helical domain-containing protein n=1 Tax=Panicum virgatum TaxID=38727 RepID=A0A8T0V1W4_PANVG|nr:hypothetical protein PVAP13_3KG325700 [Panicum virgatum]KAG2626168.1 hypothetical protein PVAP13_3KG325727 [Panicum virgatum]KAG2626169.1 hypothetical protein PVAP13_3KG325754 [Panicum virgatum]